MKGMKKLLSILMVLTLVLSLGVTAFADGGDPTVTVETNPGHDYKAYQIFAGDSQVDGDGSAIGNLTWGKDINAGDFVKALQAAGYAAEVTADGEDNYDAKDVAEALSKISASDDLKKIAHIAYDNAKKEDGTPITETGNTLPIGYYVIVDTTNVEGKDEVQNEVMLQVSGDVNITFKSDKPSSDKTVKDINDSKADSETDWQDSADHDIGDTVHYRLHAKLPTDVSAYKTYFLSFVDTLSKGLTYENTVKVYIGSYDLTKDFKVGGPTKVEEGNEYYDDYPDGTQVTWTCDDLIKAIGALGGSAATLNGADVYVEYDAKLNSDAVIGSAGNPNEMHIEYSNTPDGTGRGKNEDDKVTVFTFELIVNKVDGDGEALEGAGFTLFKKGTDGEYKEYSNDKFSGVQMVKEVMDSEGKKHYQVDFQGLDDGDYKIVETTTPDGYNTAEDIEFTIEATHATPDADPQLKSATASAPVELGSTTGVFNAEVENNKGVTLPETGGIGTTIFYIAGAILVAGAVILLVTKKRVSGMEK